ncbi:MULTISPECIES: competence type IV pilus minor pilin ComGD [Staphylococcus]|uniref:competence type IV pilus minor pilin ComGD n=1 Tax=Staphylococcus TaxID=1279 RepID=UPI0002463B1A|nr:MULTISPECIES: competence type IV pilus minor pilin ComGD [Staphylococcus]QAV31854.1 hypothetical protein SD1155_09790 [Sulfitobacter donghicola]KAB7646091.1 hypothetical protein F9280_05360 [Staphylococcus sp. B2-b]MBN6852572.1 hypothetical protein [Staphylococcus warneri]MBX7840485.1 hypothetical protein [Staphylococcus warneri]MCF7594219.1 hypothetical protein [Staphylococcus warneri]
MAKRLQIKAYNYIEMLMVLFIMSILLACTISSKNLLTLSKSNDEMNINQLITQLNYVKSKAISEKQSITLMFYNQSSNINVKEEHGKKYQLKIKDGKIVKITKIKLLTFDKNGNINHFGSLDIKMKDSIYKVIFHIEKGRIRYTKL